MVETINLMTHLLGFGPRPDAPGANQPRNAARVDKLTLSAEGRKAVTEYCKYDVELYNYALKLFEQQRRASVGDYSSVSHSQEL